MNFLALVPGLLGLIDKILPNTADRERARLELMRVIEQNKYAEYKLEVNDRVSARSMYANTKDRLVPVLAWSIIIGFVAFCFGLFLFKIPADMKDIVFWLAGQLSGAFLMVISFYFGSSASSRSKDDALGQVIQNHAEFTKEKTFQIKD